MELDEKRLAPCPFCRGAPKKYGNFEYGFAIRHTCPGVSISFSANDEEGVTELWNRRAYLSAQAGAGGEVWRCFHCSEVFTTVEAAEDHFGKSETQCPACQIDIAEYRRMEEVHQSHIDETDEASKTLYRMTSDHRQALISEEQKGYDRGLADGRAEATKGEAQSVAFDPQVRRTASGSHGA